MWLTTFYPKTPALLYQAEERLTSKQAGTCGPIAIGDKPVMRTAAHHLRKPLVVEAGTQPETQK
jgi:hypothetical protein